MESPWWTRTQGQWSAAGIQGGESSCARKLAANNVVFRTSLAIEGEVIRPWRAKPEQSLRHSRAECESLVASARPRCQGSLLASAPIREWLRRGATLERGRHIALGTARDFAAGFNASHFKLG